MPRGGSRVGAGRPKLRKDASVAAEAVVLASGAGMVPDVSASPVGELPLDYMLRCINDPEVEPSRRDRLAVAAAPYLHAKAGEGGKKEQKKDAAKTAGTGKFASAAPPRLVSSR